MEKKPNTNLVIAVARTSADDPKGLQPGGVPAAPLPPGGLPNLVVLARRAMAYWTMAAVVMVLGVLVTVQVTWLRKPSYTSETVVFYRPDVLTSDGAATLEGRRTLSATLRETLLSQSTLTKVIDEFHLHTDVVDKRGYKDAADALRKQIDFRARSTDTFVISFRGSTRDEAQKVTARLADLLAEENAKARKERARAAIEFLQTEKTQADEDLQRAEKEHAQFMAEHPEFVTDSAGGDGAAVRAEQKKDSAAATARPTGPPPVARGGANPGGPLATLAVDPLLIATQTQAMNELIAANKELSENALRFTKEHPDVRVAEARVAAAEAALRDAEAAVRAAQSSPPLAGPAPRTPVVNKVLGEPKMMRPGKLSKERLVELETEEARLRREVAHLRQQQSQQETKLFNARINERSELGGYGATIAVLDAAYRPASPSSTPSKTLLLCGFAASLLFAIALAALRGMFLDDRLFHASEIEGLGLAPVLSVVPRSKAGR